MKYSILVVDDNKMILLQIKNIFLSEFDYNMSMALNGKEACDIAVRQHTDLILLDWEMPVMNGLETLIFLKNNETTKDIPIIVITGNKNLSEAFAYGATDYIHKPIDKIELIARVKSALAMHHLLNELKIQSEKLEAQSQVLAIQKGKLEHEKQKTDNLLLNIFPESIADQLKSKGSVAPKGYKLISVLFTDFKDFTKISEQLSHKEIIEELSICFEKFDEIIEKHYIEKIKTIGDAYMCAGGLPIRNKSNPIDVVLAGLEIQKFMKDYNKIKEEQSKLIWNLRLGIHSGPAISGVIGKKKLAFDIWGDTVNTASRMESSGAVGKVNISGDTYKDVKEYFECTYRGKIEAKNKGLIDMYFVERLKEEYSKDEEGVFPNKKFMSILSTY